MSVDVELVRELAYQAGYDQALNDAAGRAAELDAVWRPAQRPTHEERVAARMAEMQRSAAKLHAQLGTTEWVGKEKGATPPSPCWVPDTTKLAEAANRALDAAGDQPLWTDWRAVHRDVSPEVWRTVWDALRHATRERYADLDPYRLGEW